MPTGAPDDHPANPEDACSATTVANAAAAVNARCAERARDEASEDALTQWQPTLDELRGLSARSAEQAGRVQTSASLRIQLAGMARPGAAQFALPYACYRASAARMADANRGYSPNCSRATDSAAGRQRLRNGLNVWLPGRAASALSA